MTSGEQRGVQKFAFSGSGTQSITVDADQYINFFQCDISINTDTTIEIKVGTIVLFTGSLIANASPIQLFFYDFGQGRGTGVKGDALHLTMGESSDVFISYVKRKT